MDFKGFFLTAPECRAAWGSLGQPVAACGIGLGVPKSRNGAILQGELEDLSVGAIWSLGGLGWTVMMEGTDLWNWWPGGLEAWSGLW